MSERLKWVINVMDNHQDFYRRIHEAEIMLQSLKLWSAVKNQNIPLALELINKGADPNVQYLFQNNLTFKKDVILSQAIHNNDVKMVKALIEQGANPNKLGTSRISMLMYALNNQNEKMIQLLKKHGAILNPADEDGNTALTWAIRHKDIKKIIFLIKAEPELINAEFPNGRTPLIEATLLGEARLVDMLINYGAEVDQTNSQNETALILAVKNGLSKMVDKLLTKGAYFSFLSREGKLLLENNILQGSYEIIFKLVNGEGTSIRLTDIQFLLEIILENLESISDIEKYIAFFSELIVKKNLFTILPFFIENFKSSIEPKYLENMLVSSCKKHHVQIIKYLIIELEYDFSAKIIGEAAYYSVARSDFQTALFLLNTSYKNLDFEYVKKIISLVAKEEVFKIFNQFLEIPGVESIIVKDEGKLLTKMQNRADSNPVLFQPYVDRLMKIEGVAELFQRIQGLYNQYSPDNMMLGAANLDIITQKLIWITKFSVQHPNHNVFYLKNNQLYVYFKQEEIEVDLSFLIEHVEFSHIFLDSKDSDFFNLSSDKLPELKKKIPSSYTLEGYVLSDAEIISIHAYSDTDHDLINGILHGDVTKDYLAEQDIRALFLKIMFIASGLNKIHPSWTRDPESPHPGYQLFRGERFISKIELHQRILRFQNNSNGFIQKQRGFSSGSTDVKIAKKFSEYLSQIHYLDFPGKNISPLSKYDEDEYLQLPQHIHINEHYKEQGINIFHANTVTFSYQKKRFIHEEYQLERLISENKSIFFDYPTKVKSLAPIFLEGLTEECQYVYDQFLSKTFTEDWLLLDWELETPLGKIPRPNHGIAHVMRVAQLLPFVAHFLASRDTTDYFHFSQREIHMMQISALFSIVGRRNEAGFYDETINGFGYKSYKKESASAFRKYTYEKRLFLMTEEEIEQYAHDILKMGNPKNGSGSGTVLTLAHKLDLIRCYNCPIRVRQSIYDALNVYLPDEDIVILMQYAEDLLHATGNRVFCGKQETDYNLPLFYAVNTNVEACLNAILSVESPVPTLFITMESGVGVKNKI